jgi:hypothetical protein
MPTRNLAINPVDVRREAFGMRRLWRRFGTGRVSHKLIKLTAHNAKRGVL